MGRTGKFVFAAVIGGALLVCFVATLSSYVQQSQSADAARARAKFPLQSCEVKGTSGALCGTYDVYEDGAAQAGRKIKLNIVVLPALGAHAAPDPVFWLHGGPGAAATSSAQFLDRGFLGPLREDRDLVFVDQRGTGKSNGLQCDLGDDPLDPQSFFGDLLPPDRVRKCREKLEKIADLKQYTTPIAMDDLDEVRSALGYDRINLVAASYGTIAAQVYMRQHPQHLRAVFLLGVASLSIKQPLLFARAAQHALELLYRDCAADAACHSAFPDLQKEFVAVLARFDRGPVEVEVPDASGQKQKFSIVRGNFVEHLRLMLYTTGTARFVPFIVHRAFLNDFVPFVRMSAAYNPPSSTARGMYMTVTCSEGVPFITEDDIARENRGTFVGEYRVRVHQRACQEWPRGDIPRSYIDPVKSDIPVLLISGDADGSTPPWFGELVVKSLSHATQVMVPHYGHQIDNLCVIGILRNFIAKGSTDGIDTTCAGNIQRPPFVVQMPPQLAGR